MEFLFISGQLKSSVQGWWQWDRIDPLEYEIKDTPYTAMPAAYLDLLLSNKDW